MHKTGDHYIRLYKSKDGKRNLAEVRKLSTWHAKRMNAGATCGPWDHLHNRQGLILTVDDMVAVLQGEGYNV